MSRAPNIRVDIDELSLIGVDGTADGLAEGLERALADAPGRWRDTGERSGDAGLTAPPGARSDAIGALIGHELTKRFADGSGARRR